MRGEADEFRLEIEGYTATKAVTGKKIRKKKQNAFAQAIHSENGLLNWLLLQSERVKYDEKGLCTSLQTYKHTHPHSHAFQKDTAGHPTTQAHTLLPREPGMVLPSASGYKWGVS